MAYPGHSADDLQEDEDEAKAWIEAVTELQKPDDESFEQWLRSGVVLCTLLNALKPGSIKKSPHHKCRSSRWNKFLCF